MQELETFFNKIPYWLIISSAILTGFGVAKLVEAYFNSMIG